MTEQKYQHEMIVTDAGFPFKLFRFEGYNGKYIRDKHWHRSIEIFAVQEGEMDFILDNTHYHLAEGEFIIVNSNEVHAIHAAKPNHTIVLQIPLNQFTAYFTGEQFIWFSHSERAYDVQVACLIFRMYEVYQEKADGYEFEILSMFYELLHILIKKYRKQEVQDELIKSNQQLNRLGVITTYLKEHYTEDISLEKLAGIMFSMIAIESGSVWNSGIVHAIWNMVMIGGGLAIGQKADQFSVMTYVLDAKSFAVTGGEFGIEASVISLMGYIIVTGVAFFGNKELCA